MENIINTAKLQLLKTQADFKEAYQNYFNSVVKALNEIATDKGIVFNKWAPPGCTMITHYKKFTKVLKVALDTIKSSFGYPANYIIVTASCVPVLHTLYYFKPERNTDNIVNSNQIGTYRGMPVYLATELEEGKFLIGNGDNFILNTVDSTRVVVGKVKFENIYKLGENNE